MEKKFNPVEYNRKWRLENPERVKEVRRKYCIINREKHNEHNRKYHMDNRDKIKVRSKRYYLNNPEKIKATARGVTLKRYWPDGTGKEAIQKYEELLKSQNYLCAICGKPRNEGTRNLAVDHCHKTGKVRGIVHMRCNRLLIGVHTSETALAVYNYLKKAGS